MRDRVVVALLCLFPVLACAADLPAAPALGWGKFMQVLLALALTLGLIWALAWASRRFRLMAPAATPVFRVIGTMALGARERLYLVDVGGEQLVLGSSTKGLETLHVMREPVALPDADTPAMNGRGFDAVLAQWMGRKS